MRQAATTNRAKHWGGSAGELFRDELRRARSRAGLTQEELAERISYSAALVTAVETGRRTPSLDFAGRCDQALGSDGLLSRVQVKVAGECGPSWFREWAVVEREAVMLRCWEPLLIPGLLQTPEYVRAVMRSRPHISEDAAERRIAKRLERQMIFDQECPPMLFAVIDESALRREVGGPELMRDQLERLVVVAAQAKVSVQVVPAAVGAHAGLCGALMIASLDESTDISYVDTALSSVLVERSEDVFELTLLFDTLRSAALPRQASIELIREVMAKWS
jgi:transcriptional regulator with XRE-family HTH domain